MTSESTVRIYFIKGTEHALTPTQESLTSARFDLRSPYETTVPARGKKLIKMDLQINLPEGYYGRTAAGMDLAPFHHLEIVGVVDENLRGNLSVLIFNHSEYPYKICRGDRIAKLICEKNTDPEMNLV
jgi:dUTP pyrophosphatase